MKWLFCVIIVLCALIHGAASPLFAQPPAKTPVVSLELTYPVGKSPRVFTQGWVFGAKAVINPGTPQAQDISGRVAWSGSGTFTPAVGSTSRPVFTRAGKNTITLTVAVEGQQIQKSYTLDTVDPYTGGPDGLRLYAVLSDLAFCPLHSHGCPNCPHTVKGPIITASPTVMIKFSRDSKEPPLPVARVGDDGIAAACCGPNTFKIAEGDPNVLIDGKRAARIGDKTSHCGGAGTGTIIGIPEKKYYVIFQPRMPELKEERKIKKREGETQEQWAQRKKAAYQNLAFNDFVFKDSPLEKSPFIMAVTDQGLKKYLEQEFIAGSQWAMKISISSKISGTLLLTSRGTYNTKEDLMAAYPFLQGKKDSKEFALANNEGTGTVNMGQETISVGPLTPKWTEQDKQESVQFAKSLLMMFDCFITNVTYGTAHAQKINVFRGFRDEVLRHTHAGEHLVHLYDEHGLSLALQLRQNPQYLPIVRRGLDLIACLIGRLDTDNLVTMKITDALVYMTDRIARIAVKDDARNDERICARLIEVIFNVK